VVPTHTRQILRAPKPKTLKGYEKECENKKLDIRVRWSNRKQQQHKRINLNAETFEKRSQPKGESTMKSRHWKALTKLMTGITLMVTLAATASAESGVLPGVAQVMAGGMLMPATAVLAQTSSPDAASPDTASPDGFGAHALEGTWHLLVTRRDCQTGAKGPSFRSLETYAAGGVGVNTTGNPAFEPGQRTDGFGVWSFQGNSMYRSVSDAFILFDSTPHPPAPVFHRGTQRIIEQIQMQHPWGFTSVATVLFLDESGKVLTRGCATAVGYRLH
jgi:hypothetical protein